MSSDAYCPFCDVLMTTEEGHPSFRTKDHVIPQSRGGRVTVYCCQACNGDKGAMSVQEFHAVLETKGDRRAKNVAWFLGTHMAAVQDLEAKLKAPRNPAVDAIVTHAAKFIYGVDDPEQLTDRQIFRGQRFAQSVVDTLRGLGMITPAGEGEVA